MGPGVSPQVLYPLVSPHHLLSYLQMALGGAPEWKQLGPRGPTPLNSAFIATSGDLTG